jgi:NAD(P)-dependent dehydrogenase (short-subunit alcohol dehydrogenase family)
MARFAGKVVLVTGAARGIGRAVAERLAGEGAHLALLDRDMATLAAAAEAVTAHGAAAFPIGADLAAPERVVAAVKAVLAHFGRIDILVNNAGRIDPRPMLEIAPEHWNGVFDVNARGLFFCLQETARAMVARGEGGKIVNIASIGGKWANLRQAHYGASKAAVISLTYTAALALAPSRINVNAVCPGIVDTAMWVETDRADARAQGLAEGEAFRRAVAGIPLGRAASSSDIAAAVAFLASRDADYITGQTLNVDGGLRQD